MFEHVKIQAGIPAIPTDTNSAEQGIIAQVDLTSGNGYMLEPISGWIPQIAQSKAGLWSNSEMVTGRVLQSIQDANVVETMQITVAADTPQALATMMVRLRRIAQLARDYWQTNEQIEPVYLNVWFQNAPGEQYALIYNMDIAESMDVMYPCRRDVTMTIEREPYWRPLVPGHPATLWSLYKHGQRLGSDVGLESVSFRTTNYHMKYERVYNVCELESSAYNSTLKDNWIDIDSSDIDGDAPALCSITCLAVADQLSPAIINKVTNGVLLTRSTLRRSITDEKGNTIIRYNNINAGDADSGTIIAAPGTNQGIISNGSNTLQYIGSASVAGAGTSTYEFDNIQAPLDVNLMVGTHRVFVRCAGGANTGDFTVSVTVNIPDDSGVGKSSYSFNAVDIGSETSTPNDCWLIPIGMITIPSVQTSEGVGKLAAEKAVKTSMGLTITFTNTTGGALTYYFYDVVFVPVNDTTSLLQFTQQINQYMSGFYDNTGYATRGKNGTSGFAISDPSWRGLIAGDYGRLETGALKDIQLNGGGITLIPGIDNRVHFTWLQVSSSYDFPLSAPYYNYTSGGNNNVFWACDVGVDIVPRWRGVRDV